MKKFRTFGGGASKVRKIRVEPATHNKPNLWEEKDDIQLLFVRQKKRKGRKRVCRLHLHGNGHLATTRIQLKSNTMKNTFAKVLIIRGGVQFFSQKSECFDENIFAFFATHLGEEELCHMGLAKCPISDARSYFAYYPAWNQALKRKILRKIWFFAQLALTLRPQMQKYQFFNS